MGAVPLQHIDYYMDAYSKPIHPGNPDLSVNDISSNEHFFISELLRGQLQISFFG
jgi:hypothetical protein